MLYKLQKLSKKISYVVLELPVLFAMIETSDFEGKRYTFSPR